MMLSFMYGNDIIWGAPFLNSVEVHFLIVKNAYQTKHTPQTLCDVPPIPHPSLKNYYII